MTMDGRTPGQRIRWLRAHLGFTQKEFARRAGGITRQSISYWENDITLPERDVLTALQDNLGVNPKWVMHGEGKWDDAAAMASDTRVLTGDELDHISVVRGLDNRTREAVYRLAKDLLGNRKVKEFSLEEKLWLTGKEKNRSKKLFYF